MEYKIGIIGNHDSIIGFKALGVIAFAVNSKEEVQKALKDIMEKQDYAVVFITENWMEKMGDDIRQYRQGTLPAIITVPTSKGTTGVSSKELKQIVEQAVGSDILSNT